MARRTRLRIVLDTNVLLVSISSRSKYHWVFRALLDGDFDLFITNEILSEYEEVIGRKYHPAVAKDVVRTLLLLPNVRWIYTFYRWQLISSDPDDNKFVDCTIAANAHALVTEDTDFNVLRTLEFPKINVLKIIELESLLSHDR